MQPPGMRNPLPDLLEATDAAAKLLTIGRDLAVLKAELKAARQAKRVGWTVAVLLFSALLVLFTYAWATVALHESGWSAESLTLVSLILFGGMAVLSAFAALRYGKPEGSTQNETRKTGLRRKET